MGFRFLIAAVILQSLTSKVIATDQSGYTQSVTPQTNATYCIGLDVDGTAGEWDSCNAPEITMDMSQVGIPGRDTLSRALRVRFAHDGTNIYVLARVRGDYHFNLTAGRNGFSHAAAVMWQVGEDATMFNMGGCAPPRPPGSGLYDCSAIRSMCTAAQCGNCDASRLTDIWHVETGSPGAIPGVQYPWRGPIVFPNNDNTYSSFGYHPEGLGRYQPAVERLFSGNDHTSNTDDEFSVHPCLQGDDGARANHLSNFRLTNTSYRNQIRYAWSHTAIDSYMYPFGPIGASGEYIYEFSRPLVTNENTDKQFQVGETASFSFAFWIPPAVGEAWEDANHYVAPSNFQFGRVMLQPRAVNSAQTAKACLVLLTVVLKIMFFL